MVLWFVWIFIMFQANVYADIFKSDEEDAQLTSLFAKPYDYQRTIIKPMISTAIDKDQEIQKSIDILGKKAVSQDLRLAPLVLLSYGAPAEADAHKHLQTVAYLRFMVDYERLKDLENNDSSDLNALRKQAIYDCVKEKYSKHFLNNISGLIDSCRSSVAFDGLNYADGKNIYEKLFNRVNLQGKKKEDVLSILPVLKINKGEIILTGPANRIGRIIKLNRVHNIKVFDDVFRRYKEQKNILEEHVLKLSMPGRPFTQREVLNLLSLEERKRSKHVEEIVAQLSIAQALEQYGEGIEYLNRYVEHPGFEGVYQNILRKAIAYLERERESLVMKLRDVNDYSIVMSQMMDAAEKEQLQTLGNYKSQEQYKALIN